MKFRTDPVSLAVFEGKLEFIVDDMMVTLGRTARSPILVAASDYGCSILDSEDRLIGLGDVIPPHCAGLGFATKACKKFLANDLAEGDVILLNDPYSGSGHLPDWTVLMPIFYKSRLAFWTAVRAHQADIGGGAAGSYNPYATDVHMEGIRIPPLKIYDRGKLRQDVFSLLMANTRMQRMVKGDLRAMMGAARTGAKRVHEVIERYGYTRVRSLVTDLLGYSESLMREEIAKLPEGGYEADSYLDGDAFGGPYKVHVTLKVRDSELVVDFNGSDRQSKGYANSMLSNTYSAVFGALLTTVGRGVVPRNEGCLTPVRIIAPEGTIVNASYPAPCTQATLNPWAEICHSVWRAVAQAKPDLAIADWCRSCSTAFAGTDSRTGELYSCIAFHESGGAGACWGSDGWSYIHVPSSMGAMKAEDHEVFERFYPFFLLYHEYLEDSGGAGKWRGGLGVRCAMVNEGSDGIAVPLSDGFFTPTRGILGGRDAIYNRSCVVRQDGNAVEINRKIIYELKRGDTYYRFSQGGGGCGDPLEREVDVVYNDVLNGFVTTATARTQYGVVVDTNLKFDSQATKDLRRIMRLAGMKDKQDRKDTKSEIG